MSALQAARTFAVMFRMLAENPTVEHTKMAHRLWEEAEKYDFTSDEMGCDDALHVLGLARFEFDDSVSYGPCDSLATPAVSRLMNHSLSKPSV